MRSSAGRNSQPSLLLLASRLVCFERAHKTAHQKLQNILHLVLVCLRSKKKGPRRACCFRWSRVLMNTSTVPSRSRQPGISSSVFDAMQWSGGEYGWNNAMAAMAIVRAVYCNNNYYKMLVRNGWRLFGYF